MAVEKGKVQYGKRHLTENKSLGVASEEKKRRLATENKAPIKGEF